VTPYLRHLSNSFSFTTSVTLAYMLTGRFVTYQPIEYRPRIGATNVRLFRDSLRTLQYIVHGITVFNPIKLFLLLSLLCGLMSLACFALAAAGLFASGALAGVIGLFVAVLVFALGLVADALQENRLS
jgi:hypothetical protein